MLIGLAIAGAIGIADVLFFHGQIGVALSHLLVVPPQ